MEYLAKKVKFSEITDVFKVGDTYQVEGYQDESNDDRRNYPAKKVRYERRTGIDENNQYVHSIIIKA